MKINRREIIPWLISIGVFSFVLLIWLILGNRGVEKIEHYIERGVERNLPFIVDKKAKPAAYQGSLAGAAIRIQPAVVSICAKKAITDVQTGSPLQGLGSGVVISPSGYVITSSVNIAKNQDIKIVNFEKTHMEGAVLEQGHHHVYNASVVSVFPAAGFAVLRVDGIAPSPNGGGLPFARLGNSDSVKMGDWCLAMGNPFSQRPVASSGIISSLNRSRSLGGRVYGNLIETTCKGAENFAGGPLVNRFGEIIGIVIKKGFAIPSNKISLILNSIGLRIQ